MVHQPRDEERGTAAGGLDSKPRKPRRWRRRMLIASLAMVLLYASREYTLHPLGVRCAPWVAARFTSYELALGDVDSDWFSSLRLEELSLRSREAGGTLRALEAERLEVRWSLLALVRGEERWLSSLGAVGVVGEVALGEGADADTGEPASALPRLLPAIDVERLDLLVRMTDGAQVTVSDASLRVLDGADMQTIEAELPLRYTDSDGVRYAHKLDATLGWAGAEIEVKRMSVDGVEVIRPGGRLDLRELHEERIAWDLALDLPADRAHTSGALSEGQLQATIDFGSIDLVATRKRFSGLVPLLPEDLGGSLTVQCEVSTDLSIPRPHGSLRVLAEEVVAAGRSFTSLELLATAAGESAMVTHLEVQAPGGRLEANEVSVSLADLELDAILESLGGVLVADVNELGVMLHGARLAELPPLPAHHLTLRARLEGGAAHLDAGRLDVAGGHVDLTGGSIALLESEGGGRTARVLLDLDLPDLAAVGALFDAGEWGGSLVGAVSLEGDLPMLVGHAELTGTDVVVAGTRLGALEVLVDADTERVEITRCEANSPEAGASLSGTWLVGERKLVDVVLDLDVLEPQQLSDLVAEGGHLRLHAELSGPLDALAGRVTAEGSRLRLGGREVHALELAGAGEDGVFEITTLHAALDQGTIDARLVATLPSRDRPLGVHLTALELVGDGGGLALTRPVSIEIGEERIALEALELAGDAGRIAADVELAGGRTQARVTLEDLDPMPFLGGLVPAGFAVRGVDAAFDFEHAAGVLSVSGSGRIADLRTPADEASFDLAWRFALEDGRATVEQLRATTGGATVLDLTASVPLDPTAEQLFGDGPIELAGRVSLPSGRSFSTQYGERTVTLSGALDVALALGGTWRGVTGTIGLDGRSIVVDSGADAEILMPEPATMDVALVLRDDSLLLERFRVTAPQRGEVDLAGSVGLGVDVVALSGGSAAWREAPLHLTGDYSIADLSWLAALAPGVRRLMGTVVGQVELAGTLGEPGGRAGLELRDGALRVAGIPPLERLAIDASYADGVIELAGLSAELGAAPLSVTGRVDSLFDGNPGVALDVTGTNVLLSRSSSARLRADLALQVRGPMDSLVVSGEVHLRNARVTQTIDFLGMLQGVGASGVGSQQQGIAISLFDEGPLAACAFDIDVDTSEPVEIRSNVARGSVNLGLHIGGTGELLIPDGRIFLEPTRILLPSGALQLEGGFIELDEADPLFPRLELFGETRMLGYDISVSISGRYDEPVIALSSVPPLAADELLILLLTGSLPSGTVGSQAAQVLTVYLAKDLFTRWSDDGLDSDGESMMDRYEFVTGRDVSRTGVLTMEASYRIRDAVLNDRDALFLVAERDRYEEFNIGLRLVLRLK